MNIFVKDPSGLQSYFVDVLKYETILDLKQKLIQKYHLEYANFYLVGGCKILNDQNFFSDYNFRDSVEIEMHIRLYGGMEDPVERNSTIKRTVIQKSDSSNIKHKSTHSRYNSYTMNIRSEFIQKLENQIYLNTDSGKDLILTEVKNIKFSSSGDKFYILAMKYKVYVYSTFDSGVIHTFERDGINEIEPISQPDGVLCALENKKIELYSLKSKTAIKIIEPSLKGKTVFMANFIQFQENYLLMGSDLDLSFEHYSMKDGSTVRYDLPQRANEQYRRGSHKLKSMLTKKNALIKFVASAKQNQYKEVSYNSDLICHAISENHKYAFASQNNNIYSWNLESQTYLENFNIVDFENIISLRVSLDGKFLAVLGTDYTGLSMVKILDPRAKSVQSSIKNIDNVMINHLAFLNTYCIITGSSDGSVKIVDFIKLEETHNYKSHSKIVSAITVHPNQKHFMTGSIDGSVSIVKTEKKELIEVIKEAHKQPIYSIAITRDSQYLVSSGSWDGLITIWNLNTLSSIHSYHTSHELILCITLTPDDKYIASGANDGCVGIWDIAKRNQYHMFSGIQHEAIHSIATTPCSRYVVTGGTDRSIVILDLVTKDKNHVFQEVHQSTIYALCVTSDGKYIVSGGHTTIAILDFKRKEIVHRINSVQKSFVMCLALTSDDKCIIVGGQDKSIGIYNFENKTLYHTFPEAHEGTIVSVNVSPCGNHLVSGSDDGSINIYDLTNKQTIHNVRDGHQGRVETILFTPNGKKIVSCSRDKNIILYELIKEEKVHMFEKAHEEEWIYCLAISPDSNYVVTGSGDRSIRLFSIDRKECLHVWENAHDGLILALTYAADGKYIISSSGDCCVKVFDTETKDVIYNFEYIHTGYIFAIASSFSGKYLYTGSEDKSIKKFNLENFSLEAEFVDAHDDKITCLCFTEDDEYLVSSSKDRSISIFSTQRNKKEYTLPNVHGISVNCVTTFRNQFVISGGADKAIVVHNILTREKIFTFDNIHEDEIVSVSMLPGTQFISSAGKDKKINISDLETHKNIFSLSNLHKDCIHAMKPTPDGRYLISASRDMSIGVFLNPFPKNEVVIISDDSSLSPYSRIGPMLLDNHFIKQTSQYYLSKFIQKYSKFRIIPYNWNLLHLICVCFPHRFLFSQCKLAKIHLTLDNNNFTPLHYLFNYEKTDYSLVNDILQNFDDSINDNSCGPGAMINSSRLIESMSNIIPEIFYKTNLVYVANLLSHCVRIPFTYEGNEIPRFGRLKSKSEKIFDFYEYPIMKTDITNEKIDENGTEVLKIKTLLLKLDYNHFSNDMINMIKIFRKVKNEVIFKTEAVKMIVDHLWIHARPFYLFLLLLYSVLMILLSILIGRGESSASLENAIIVIASIFFVYEMIQMKNITFKVYFSEIGNSYDITYFGFLIATIASLKTESSEHQLDTIGKNWIRALCIFFGYIKWLYFFRVINQTRSLIRMIAEIIKAMASFVIVLLLIIFGFSLVFYEFNASDSYSNKLLAVYQLLYANYDSPGETISEIIFFVIVTFLLTIVLLNMLIAIMSDTYERIKSNSILTDNLEKVELIYEALIIQRAFCLKRLTKKNKKNGRSFDKGNLFEFSIENFNNLDYEDAEKEALRSVIREEFKFQNNDKKRITDEDYDEMRLEALEESLRSKIEDMVERENRKQYNMLKELIEINSKKLARMEIHADSTERRITGLDRKLDNILTLVAGSPHIIQKMDMQRISSKTLTDF